MNTDFFGKREIDSNSNSSNNEQFGTLDGLRTISCFAIIAMHIQANTVYNISGLIWGEVIPSLTWLVYLFLMISGFGMCAGYLSRFQNSTINLEFFYKKRYRKILPFFGFLIFIALIIEPTITNVYEASIELTLLYGLLPNNEMNVLGVSWTLGVIFLFYLLFPFFSVLLKTKRRALVTLVVSLWINYVCENYFFTEKYVNDLFTPRHSFIYCFPLFIGGGILYLYKENIKKFCGKYKYLVLLICNISTILWYIIPSEVGAVKLIFYKSFILFMFWLTYAIGVNSKFLSNKFMKFFSNISLELYLAQMVIFRIVEKFNLLYVFGDGWLSFLLTFLLVIIGLVVFIQVYKYLFDIVKKFLRY